LLDIFEFLLHSVLTAAPQHRQYCVPFIAESIETKEAKLAQTHLDLLVRRPCPQVAALDMGPSIRYGLVLYTTSITLTRPVLPIKGLVIPVEPRNS
jgi:hypothetical protein